MLLQRAQNARLEQDLTQANSVQFRVHSDLVEDLEARLLVALGRFDSGGCQNAVPGQELLVEEAGGVALAADANAFEDTVAVELLHHQVSV